VQIVTADARHTGLRSGSFDLVHARTLLIANAGGRPHDQHFEITLPSTSGHCSVCTLVRRLDR
jgi:hypothetical protein